MHGTRARRSSNVVTASAAAAALLERLAFERLLAELSSRLANVAGPAVFAEIQKALQRLVEFFGYDRCTFSEFAADESLNILCSAAAKGFEPHPTGPFNTQLTWFFDELRAGRIIALPEMPDGLPAQAVAEAEYCRRTGLRSHLSIPLRAGGRTAGVLSFAGFRRSRSWPAEVIIRLGIIGEMFIGAMRRARVEEEAQQLRARVWHADRVSRVSALSSALAHEINQPLCAILSNAQAALANLDRGEVRPEEIREILQDVVRDDKRAADTIRTMRAFLRHDNGGRERIDVAAAMQDVLHLLAAEFRSKAIRIEARLEPDCWTIADKTQIEQVALNLLLNAAAAMESSPAGERLLQLSSARTGDGRIAVKVRDAGVGIAPENLEMVFEPFWTTRKEGLGLGLAICRSIIETHDGNILVEPNADRGVTFRFELAADEGAAAPQPTPLPGAPPEPAAPHVVAAGPVVCVIDDETAVREGVVRLLAAQGWSAACYESADEFLRHRPAADVGCLVLDNHMPGMSGRELQAHLARSGAAIPVVFLSGHGDVSTSVAAMKQGAVDFLLKPVDGGQLVAAVRRALARHASARSRVLELDAGMTRLGKLSARERQVMNEVIRGRLNKQIAADLEIALQTVKQHRARVMQKMGATSLADLVRMCEALLGGMPAAAQPPSATIAPISSTPIAAMPRPARQALPPE